MKISSRPIPFSIRQHARHFIPKFLVDQKRVIMAQIADFLMIARDIARDICSVN
jgi:hypothetical protein